MAWHGKYQQSEMFKNGAVTIVKKGWHIEQPCVGQCGRMEDKPVISLSDMAYRKMETALAMFHGSEWLAYLLGEVTEGGAKVDDLIVPKQEVTSASVKVLEVPENPRIIGTVHSHGGCGGSFSQTDKEHILANHPVGILAGSTYSGVVRLKTPCGMWYSASATVTVALPKKHDGFKKELEENIAKAAQIVSVVQGYPAYGPYGDDPYGDRWLLQQYELETPSDDGKLRPGLL